MKRLVIIFVLCFSACLVGYCQNQQESELYTLDGRQINYSDLFKGKNILMIWTSGCFACQSELVRFSNKPLDAKGINIYYVNAADQKWMIERVAINLELKKHILDKIIVDPRADIAREFRVIFVPTYIFIYDSEVVYQSNSLSNYLIKKVFED